MYRTSVLYICQMPWILLCFHSRRPDPPAQSLCTTIFFFFFFFFVQKCLYQARVYSNTYVSYSHHGLSIETVECSHIFHFTSNNTLVLCLLNINPLGHRGQRVRLTLRYFLLACADTSPSIAVTHHELLGVIDPFCHHT